MIDVLAMIMFGTIIAIGLLDSRGLKFFGKYRSPSAARSRPKSPTAGPFRTGDQPEPPATRS